MIAALQEKIFSCTEVRSTYLLHNNIYMRLRRLQNCNRKREKK